MKAVGIICEYNPFHNGHIYHLKKVRELCPNDVIILILSGNVTQRGELSLLSKWEKTELALKYGVDLVVELPYSYASQAADIFCEGSINILNSLKVSKIIFGSELNDINILTECAKVQLSDLYQEKIQKYLNNGINYPTALSKSLKELTNYDINNPNDLLGLGYVKEILKNHYDITPFTIQRTNNYHDKNFTGSISSATSIREHLLNKEDLKNTIPSEVMSYLTHPVFLKDFFHYIKYKIIVENDLTKYCDIDINLANRLKEKIQTSDTLDEFLNNVKTKYYTYNRLMRTCSHILFSFTKEEKQKKKSYIRILGFNSLGQTYLRQIKKEIKIPIITNYSNDKESLLDLELRVSKVLSLVKGKKFIIEEINHKPIIK